MKFLIDNALSPGVAVGLRRLGHDSTHVRDLGLHAAEDIAILDLAAREARVLITTDADFAALLATRNLKSPSLVILRRRCPRQTDDQVRLLAANLALIAGDLERGCVAVFQSGRVRIRPLPIGDGD